MQPRSLVQFARFKPLAAWSLSASVLGASLALYLGGGSLADPWPMVVAMACVILLQYVAHPMNDLMDLDLDRAAPIATTGRYKPLVDGSATVREATGLSALIVIAVLVMMAYLVLTWPVLILPAIYGLVALFGYNHPRLRWAYRPYTELYLSMPINALSVLVISFTGSGIINGMSVAVSLIFGFASSAFFVSMMSMDYPTDSANGKVTTVVRWPRARYCTIYPLIGLLVMVAVLPLMTTVDAGAAIPLAMVSAVAFSVLAWFGWRADSLRIEHIDGAGDRPEKGSGRLRLGQLYISVALALSLSLILLMGGL